MLWPLGRCRIEGDMSDRYRIVVRGDVGPAFVEPFQGVSVEESSDESTLLIDAVDQTHLQGLLSCLHDRGIAIVSLNPA
jgi:hypothetical protein